MFLPKKRKVEVDVPEFEPEARNLCGGKRVPCCGPSLTSQHHYSVRGRSQVKGTVMVVFFPT